MDSAASPERQPTINGRRPVAAPLELVDRPLDGEALAPPASHPLPTAASVGELLAALDRPHSFRRHRWRRVALATTVIAVLVLRWQASGVGISAANLSEGRYQVASVRDATTLELTGGIEVRLLGIEPIARSPAERNPSLLSADSTKTDSLGTDAIELARRLVAGGHVRLQFDRTRIDNAGRCLAYVWLDDPPSERLLNEELLRAGLCRPALNPPCSSAMKRRLAQASAQARAAGRGLWAKD
jgi:endonuclease YncB( thermonuclease family)